MVAYVSTSVRKSELLVMEERQVRLGGADFS